jgi:DTW domain-containing protein
MPRKICSECCRPELSCYCGQIRRIENHWPVHILQDRRESRHALGTARIAAMSLSACQLHVYDPEQTDSQETSAAVHKAVAPGTLKPVLVYPGQNAEPIDSLASGPVRSLIFLDASWRRSRLMLHSQPALASLPRVCLNNIPPSRYRIRRPPSTDALSTLEAIAAALGALENRVDVYEPMLQTMDWMIDQQIKQMGELVYRSNYMRRSSQ